jgi:Arc/MetJ-type ribon-helix-helix transcriptional regulator
MVVMAFRIPQSISNKLEQMSNASDFVRQALQNALASGDQEILNSKVAELKEAIIQAELRSQQEIARLRYALARAEASLNSAHIQQTSSIQARLEQYQGYRRLRRNVRDAREMRGWLTGPRSVELLSECGFRDLDEAGAWMEEEYQREIKSKLVR